MDQTNNLVGNSVVEGEALSLPQQESGNLGPLQRLSGVLFSPGKTFEDINRKPTWLAPIIIATIISGAFVVYHQFVVKADWIAIAGEEMKRAAALGAAPNRPMRPQELARTAAFNRAVTTASYLIEPPITCLILAAVFALALMLMQAQATFRKILSVVAWSYCGVGLISTVVLAGSMWARGFEDVRALTVQKLANLSLSNPGVLLPSNASPSLRALLDSIDLFSVWLIVLLAMGFAATGGSKRITTSGTGAVVAVLWALYVVGKIGWAALFG